MQFYENINKKQINCIFLYNCFSKCCKFKSRLQYSKCALNYIFIKKCILQAHINSQIYESYLRDYVEKHNVCNL
jgi:hypothetical protein